MMLWKCSLRWKFNDRNLNATSEITFTSDEWVWMKIFNGSIKLKLRCVDSRFHLALFSLRITTSTTTTAARVLIHHKVKQRMQKWNWIFKTIYHVWILICKSFPTTVFLVFARQEISIFFCFHFHFSSLVSWKWMVTSLSKVAERNMNREFICFIAIVNFLFSYKRKLRENFEKEEFFENWIRKFWDSTFLWFMKILILKLLNFIGIKVFLFKKLLKIIKFIASVKTEITIHLDGQ